MIERDNPTGTDAYHGAEAEQRNRAASGDGIATAASFASGLIRALLPNSNGAQVVSGLISGLVNGDDETAAGAIAEAAGQALGGGINRLQGGGSHLVHRIYAVGDAQAAERERMRQRGASDLELLQLEIAHQQQMTQMMSNYNRVMTDTSLGIINNIK